MKIKQTMIMSGVAVLFSLSLSVLNASSVFALTKTEFKNTICPSIQGPGAEETCRKAIDKNGEYTFGTSGITYKFSDWKAKTVAELEQSLKDDLAPDDGSASDGGGDGCGGADTAIIKCDADNKTDTNGDGKVDIADNGVWALLIYGINILTAGIGIAAVGGIIYGSIMYTTAGDNEGQIKQAKEIIRNVIVGIILYIAMYAILQFIIPGGVFTP